MRASTLASKSALLTVLCLASWIQPGDASADPTFTALHSFSGTPDGAVPFAGLISDKFGALYGTTLEGGAYNAGTVFKLTPPVTKGGAWTESVLYNFTEGSDGANPQAGLIFDRSGALYGTTGNGGAHDVGTVFKLTLRNGAWTETVLHSFMGGSDGAVPFAGLIFDRFDALYGTTAEGGGAGCSGFGCGTVFKLTAPVTKGGAWIESVLYNFTGGDDGGTPEGGLTFDDKSQLYGTTVFSGAYNAGTVFKLTPPVTKGGAWTESVLHNFTGGSDGYGPIGNLVLDRSDALYGTAFHGGAYNAGTVFKLTPPVTKGGAWTESVLHNFTGSDGDSPQAGVIFDRSRALYGMTTLGGVEGRGTVFKLMPPVAKGGAWTESVLYNFTGASDGAQPQGGLIFDDKFHTLYGTTSISGDTSCDSGTGCGTVFKLTLPTQEENDDPNG